jgi:AcrR family transcriptional regulator
VLSNNAYYSAVTKGVKRPEETRADITLAAAAAFAEHGYDGVRVHDIARRAGVTTGAIYAHYAGRAALIAAALDAQVSSVLPASVVDEAGPPLPDWLIGVAVRLLVDPGAAGSPLEIEALVAARREPELADRLGGRLTALHDRFAARVAAGQAAGEFTADLDPQAFTYFCHALLLGMVLLDPAVAQRPGEAEWTALIGRLLSSLSARRPD